jgi:hypothetical protein
MFEGFFLRLHITTPSSVGDPVESPYPEIPATLSLNLINKIHLCIPVS